MAQKANQIDYTYWWTAVVPNSKVSTVFQLYVLYVGIGSTV